MKCRERKKFNARFIEERERQINTQTIKVYHVTGNSINCSCCNDVLRYTVDCVLAVLVAGNSNPPANTRTGGVAAVAVAVVDSRVYQSYISTSFAAAVAY